MLFKMNQTQSGRDYLASHFIGRVRSQKNNADRNVLGCGAVLVMKDAVCFRLLAGIK